MQGHLGKPIDPDELHSLVASYCPADASAGPRVVGVVDEAPVQSAGRSREQDSAATQLPLIPGLDMAAGLGRTRNKLDLYTSLLRQFAAAFESFGVEIKMHLQENRLEEAQRLAHSLKGVAANVGAGTISDAAGELERQLRAGDAHDGALAQVERELQPALAALRSYLAVEAPPDEAIAPEVTPPEVRLPEWVKELRDLLVEGDIAAQRLWAERGEELQGVVPLQAYLQIRRAVENFEFDAALEALSACAGPKPVVVE
jgi:two-component system sensor histidine kinase/response regulator